MPGHGNAAGGGGASEGPFLGGSREAEEVRKAIQRASLSDATVLITGESGVGKELVARAIHRASPRGGRPFVAVNCAALPDTLVESELFGHEAGAYTDARARKRGAFELASGGTLLLDEVGDLSPGAQPKILRAIESGEIVRVGGEQPQPVDLRTLAATNHDLRSMCKAGTFRWDLYYRLRVLEIRVPPLRERAEDIPELARHFATGIARRTGREFHDFTADALEVLRRHRWPGNVRELRSVVENALAMSSGARIPAEALRLDPASSPNLDLEKLMEADWHTARDRFEAEYAARLLRTHGNRVTLAARAAGLAPRSLYKILHRLGLWGRTRSG